MIPELQSPIPSAKAASAFLSLWMLARRKRLRGRKNWRNVKIQPILSRRAEVRCKRSYLGTPLRCNILDQNGTVESSIFCLFFSVPSWSLPNLSYLARPMKLVLVFVPAWFRFNFASDDIIVSSEFFALWWSLELTWNADTEAKLDSLQECNGYNSYIVAQRVKFCHITASERIGSWLVHICWHWCAILNANERWRRFYLRPVS